MTSNFVCLIVDLFCAVRVYVNQSLATKVTYQSYLVVVVGGKSGVFANYTQSLFPHTNMLHP